MLQRRSKKNDQYGPRNLAKHAQNDQTCSTQKIAKYDEKSSFFFLNVERNNIKVNKNAYQKWHIRCKVGQS